MSSTSKMPGVTDIARKEYLKKYLSSSTGKKENSEKRKKRKENKGQPSGKGLRLIEEDAFLPIPTAMSKQQLSDEEDDDESYGDEFRRDSKAKSGTAGPSFKASSFVAVSHEDPSDRGHTISAARKRVQRKPDGDSGADDSHSSIARRRQATADDDGDLSPARRPTNNRKAVKSPDASPPRRRRLSGREHPSSSDESPPRRPTASRSPDDDDASPPRRSSQRPSKEIKREVESESEECGGSEARSTKPPMGDGRKKAGLVTMKEMREETRRLNEEEEKKMKQFGDEVSGRNAETRRRETGFRNKRDSKESEERKRREAEKQEELDKKYKSWNKGVAQLQQREQKLQEMEQTVKEGFARYADDKAMNEHLKAQIQDEDPMADYIKTKRHKVQMKEGLVYPTYKGHWPPNRFAISPGYRWDGVNRSNGFEAKLASAENKRRAQEEVTYKSIMECED